MKINQITKQIYTYLFNMQNRMGGVTGSEVAMKLFWM